MTQLTSLPGRLFLKEGQNAFLDDDGFLLTELCEFALGAQDLLRQAATLVLAPPWTGKSFVAKSIDTYLARGLGSSKSGGRHFTFHRLTSFEMTGIGSSIKPPWWDEWLGSIGANACWIIDAVDEDERMEHRQVFEALQCLEELDEEKRCNELSVILLCRENEVPPRFHEVLSDIYAAADEPRALARVTLAPLDRDSAVELLGGQAQFEKAESLIRRNGLQAVARMPAVLECLGACPPDSDVTKAGLWRQVLESLLAERRASVRPGTTTTARLRFQATSRIAAVLTLSGEHEVRSGQVPGAGPAVDEIPYDSDRHPEAGWDALATAVFQRTVTGYRFGQHHVQEWFTAFELQSYALTRLKPLLAGETDEPFARYRGLLGILHQITESDDVRDWIVESFDGLPPWSDAAPWSHQQARTLLDKLQEQARATEWGLFQWSGVSFRALASPGIGAELLARLAARGLRESERTLLLEVADDVGAREVVEVAIEYLRDSKKGDRLRARAGGVVCHLASDEQLQSLVGWIRRSKSRNSIDIRAAVLMALLSRKLLPFSEILHLAPASEDSRSSLVDVLFMRLAEGMTLTDARVLVRNDRGGAVHEEDRGRGRVTKKAFELVCAQDPIPPQDYRLLIGMATEFDLEEARRGELQFVLQAIQRDERARRVFFKLGVHRTLQGDGPHRWILMSSLESKDVDWLVTVAVRHLERAPWIAERALMLSSADDPEGARERVRSVLVAEAPGLVAEFETRSAELELQEREFEEDRAARQEREEAQSLSIEAAVQSAISASEESLSQAMWSLTWMCFMDEGERPTNVVGDWSDLDERVRAEVYRVCRAAMKACEQTAVPDGTSVPGSVVYEGRCFTHLSLHTESEYVLDGEQVRRWLPSATVFSRSDLLTLIEACIRADEEATSDVLIERLRQVVESGAAHIPFVRSIPVSLWEGEFGRATAEVLDECTNAESAQELFDLLVQHGGSRGRALAEKWIVTSSAEEGA